MPVGSAAGAPANGRDSREALDGLVAEYLRELEQHVSGLPVLQRRELLRDLEAHITNERAEHPALGETELLDILERLGSPAAIAAAAFEEAGLGSTASQAAIPSIFEGAAARFSGRAVVALTAPAPSSAGVSPAAVGSDGPAFAGGRASVASAPMAMAASGPSAVPGAAGSGGMSAVVSPAGESAAGPAVGGPGAAGSAAAGSAVGGPGAAAAGGGPAAGGLATAVPAYGPASLLGVSVAGRAASVPAPGAAGPVSAEVGQGGGGVATVPEAYVPPAPKPEAYVPPRSAPAIPPAPDRVRGSGQRQGSSFSGSAPAPAPHGASRGGRRGPFPPSFSGVPYSTIPPIAGMPLAPIRMTRSTRPWFGALLIGGIAIVVFAFIGCGLGLALTHSSDISESGTAVPAGPLPDSVIPADPAGLPDPADETNTAEQEGSADQAIPADPATTEAGTTSGTTPTTLPTTIAPTQTAN
ncbi:HAAS signaling domain-containing protein [Winogradskya consettensis]|uniref:HAAS signaling domain-containing protein n=1 Tax=Winogradskya consettensis TaxID=113560 RepID=UPI001BB3D3B0|nr:hypothetical protein [Actinoplanes consettensis]